MCLNIKICKYLCPNETNVCNFQPLEVVSRGSETQLQVAENLNKLIGSCAAKPNKRPVKFIKLFMRGVQLIKLFNFFDFL